MTTLPPNTTLFPDAEATARAAADFFIETCGETEAERIAICLSGGSTPRRLYELLASPDYVDRVLWQRLHFFFNDDRVVPWDDGLSNVRMVREAFGHGAALPPTHFHFIPSDRGPEDGAKAYEETLKGFYGADELDPERPLFDLVLLGLGTDGHTASLFPGKHEIADERSWAVAVPEAGMEPFIPRISLTFPVLASARHVLFLVNGAGKREPLTRLAEGEDLPAARAARGGNVHWFIDEAAAGA